MEISTKPITFCTTCCYWKHFETEKRLLLPWKRNLEAGLMWKMTWSVCYHVFSLEYYFLSFIFLPTFPLGRVAGAAALGRLEIPHDQEQSQIILLAQHQNGTKQGRRCYHSTWSLGEHLAAFPWFSQQDLPSQTLLGLSGHLLINYCRPNQCTWDLSIRRSGSTFRALRISHFVAKCHTVNAGQGVWREYWPLTFQKGPTVGRGTF